MTLRPIPISQPDQVERLRLLRNATKDGYASFNDDISEAQQILWWQSNRGRVQAWLYANEASEIVGFGLIRRDDEGRWWTTVGVSPEHGGRNWGKQITHHLVTAAPGRCYGTARRDNPAAVRLHVIEDWEPVDGPDASLAYFRTWPREASPWTDPASGQELSR